MGDVEIGIVVFAGKKPPADKMIKHGIGVAARDEDAFLGLAVFVLPVNGDAMGCVFAGDADKAGKTNGPDLLEPDEADSGDGRAGMELGTEFVRELALNDFGCDAKVEQDAAANEAFDARKFHVVNAASQSFQTGS